MALGAQGGWLRSFVLSLFCSSRLHFRIPRGTFHSELLSSVIVIIMLCITRFIIDNLLHLSTIIHTRTGLHGMKRVVLLGVGASGGPNTKARLALVFVGCLHLGAPCRRTSNACLPSLGTLSLCSLYLFPMLARTTACTIEVPMFLLRFLYTRLCPPLL